jgi:K+-transporting ATPase ATPase C chain
MLLNLRRSLIFAIIAVGLTFAYAYLGTGLSQIAFKSKANGIAGESGASNLGPRSSVLLDNTKELVQYWHKLGVNPTPDLVTTSGSGYDPDIAPEDALVQIPMVSKATGIAPAVLRQLITKQTHGEQWGFLGSSYIVVLQLNEALAKLK